MALESVPPLHLPEMEGCGVSSARKDTVNKKKMKPAALGFRVHTGWAAMIAVVRPSASSLPTILDRRRGKMIAGSDPPRFVYHAAAKLTLDSAKRFVLEAKNIGTPRRFRQLAQVFRLVWATSWKERANGVLAADLSLPPRVYSIPR